MAFPDGWKYKMEVVISNTNIDSPLSNFPILLHGGSLLMRMFSRNKYMGKPDGADFRVTSDRAGDTPIHYEIENWEDDGRYSRIWVSVPTLSSASVTSIWVWWGNPSASAPVASDADFGSEGVWDSDFQAVYHMNNSSGTLTDSTGNDEHGTFNGDLPDAVSGKVYNAQDFDGADDYVRLPNESDFDFSAFTCEAWATVDSWISTYAMLVGKGDTAWRISREATTDYMHVGVNGLSTNITGTVSVAGGDFHYIAGRYDSTIGTNPLALFIDGVLDNGATPTGTLSTNNIAVDISNNSEAGGRFWDGKIDEVRISKVGRSDAWIKATYHFINNPTGQIVSIGEVEGAGDSWLEGWRRRQRIRTNFQSLTLSADVLNIPVLVVGGAVDSELFSGDNHADPEGKDIRFSKNSTDTPIHSEIDSWDYTGGDCEIWMGTDYVEYDSFRQFFMWYSKNHQLIPAIDRADFGQWDLWSNCNCVLRYSMDDSLLDSTENEHDAVKVCDVIDNTTDGTGTNKLILSTATFTTDGLTVGDVINNTTDTTSTTLTAVDSDSTLSIADDIFISGENYEIVKQARSSEVAGIVGNAQDFDGPNGEGGEYIDCGTNTDIEKTDNFTFSCWCKMEAGNSGVYMGIAGKALLSGAGWMLVRHSDDYFKIWIHDSVDGWQAVVSDSTYTGTDWKHIAFKKTSGVTRLYVDGVLQSASYTHSGTASDSGTSMAVGKQYLDYNNRHWIGQIDEVRYYSDAKNDDWMKVEHATVDDPSAWAWENEVSADGSQFPADYTLLGAIRSKGTYVDSNQNDIFLINEDQLDSALFAAMQQWGGDIVISTDAFGTARVAIDMEWFDAENEEATIWIKAAINSAGGDTFYIWGGTGEDDEQPFRDTTYGYESIYSSDYKYVAHFDEFPFDDQVYCRDRTSNEHDFVGRGTMPWSTGNGTMPFEKYVQALLSTAFDFFDYDDDADFDFGTGDFTISCWVFHYGDLTTRQIFVKVTSGSGNVEFQLQGDHKIQWWLSDSGGAETAGTSTALTQETWYKIVFKRDGTSVSLTINASKEATATSSRNVDSVGKPTIGRQTPGTEYFSGLLDEFRISKGAAKSDDYIKASYYNEVDTTNLWEVVPIPSDTTLNLRGNLKGNLIGGFQ